MLAKCVIALLALVHLGDCSEQKSYSEEARIVGGKEAKPGEYPYAAALSRDGSWLCTASVISPTTVLTAAHCVVDDNDAPLDASRFSVIAGNVKKSGPETNVTFKSLNVHPDYGDLKNDIAFFTAKEPIEFEGLRTLCIPRSDTGLNEYKNAVAMGWGSTSRIPLGGREYPDNLMYAPMELKPHSFCEYRYPNTTDETHICADGKGKGICYGDSGGPLVNQVQDRQELQLGVASFVRAIPGCGSFFSSPGVYTRLSKYTQWIIDESGDSEICVI